MKNPTAADPHELISRLRRIEGQVRGIQRMLAAEAPCVEVLTQVSAVVSGMERVGLRLLREHMRRSVADALRSKDRGEQQIDEVVKVVERFLAS